jgi:hypothetical protein
MTAEKKPWWQRLGWPKSLADAADNSEVFAIKRFRKNDYNIGSDGVLRQGTLERGVGVAIPTPPPLSPDSARIVEVEIAPRPPHLMELPPAELDAMIRRIVLSTGQYLHTSNAFADACARAIETGAPPQVIEVLARLADEEAAHGLKMMEEPNL